MPSLTLWRLPMGLPFSVATMKGPLVTNASGDCLSARMASATWAAVGRAPAPGQRTNVRASAACAPSMPTEPEPPVTSTRLPAFSSANQYGSRSRVPCTSPPLSSSSASKSPPKPSQGALARVAVEAAEHEVARVRVERVVHLHEGAAESVSPRGRAPRRRSGPARPARPGVTWPAWAGSTGKTLKAPCPLRSSRRPLSSTQSDSGGTVRPCGRQDGVRRHSRLQALAGVREHALRHGEGAVGAGVGALAHVDGDVARRGRPRARARRSGRGRSPGSDAHAGHGSC